MKNFPKITKRNRDLMLNLRMYVAYKPKNSINTTEL